MEPINVGNSLYLKSYAPRIEATIKELTMYQLQGGYGGSLNLKEIATMLNGAAREISRLQSTNDELIKTLNQKEAQLKKLGENVSNG